MGPHNSFSHAALLLIPALMAQSPLGADGIFSALINFGAMGMLALTLFYLHTKALKDHKEELAEERKAWADRYDRLEEQMEKSSAQTMTAFAGLERAIEGLRWYREMTSAPEYHARQAQQAEAISEERRRRQGGGK